MDREPVRKNKYYAGAPGSFSVLPGEIDDMKQRLAREGKNPKQIEDLVNAYVKKVKGAELPEREPTVYHLKRPPQEGAGA